MAIELNQIWDFPIKEFHPFPRALLGVGAHDILGVEAKNLGFKRTLFVTTGLRGSGIIDELKGKVEHQGVEVVVYDKCESNPKDYNCMDAAALYQSEGCDSIISIGGGSSHDAAKGARVVIAHDGRNINEFEGFSKSTNMQNPPHIAVSHDRGHRWTRWFRSSVRPLLEAILSEDPVVLLVDEVDRTEEAMEALLLEVLAERQVTIPEVGTFTARSLPWVVLTSNDTRELSPALKRRCVHFHVRRPGRTGRRPRERRARRARDRRPRRVRPATGLPRAAPPDARRTATPTRRAQPRQARRPAHRPRRDAHRRRPVPPGGPPPGARPDPAGGRRGRLAVLRSITAFALRLAQTLHRMAARCHVLAYVDRAVDVTDALLRSSGDGALAAVLAAPGVDLDATSDYGQVLAGLNREHANLVDRRTAVLFVGDGRCNGLPTGVEELRRLRRQAHRVGWITPEPRRYWTQASCAMPQYAEIVDHVTVARDADELLGQAGELGHALS